jgi:predicted kinase
LPRKIVERVRCAYIGLDDINAERGLWGGDGISVEEWECTHALARARLAIWMATGKDALVDDVNNLRWLRDRWRALATASGYDTVVIYLEISQAELIARRRANQVSAERKGITDTVWAKHLNEFEPPGKGEHVLRYGPADHTESWLTKHFGHPEADNPESSSQR